MLTIVHLLIVQFPVHSGASFFFLEVLPILQKIVCSCYTVVEYLFVCCGAVSIISTDNAQPSPTSLPPRATFSDTQDTVETHPLFVFVSRHEAEGVS